MKSIGFISIKGGCGKSSLAILTANMTAAAGLKTLFIDADVQNSGTFYYLPESTEPEGRNLARALMGGNLSANVITTGENQPDIIASSFDLLKLRGLSIRTLSQSMGQLEGLYDAVIIDTAPTLDALVLNAAQAVDTIITPVLPSSFDWKSALFLRDQLTLELGPDCLDKWHVLRNRWKAPRANAVNSAITQYNQLFADSLTDNLLPATIPECAAVRQLIDFRSALTRAGRKGQLCDAIELVINECGIDLGPGVVRNARVKQEVASA